MAIDDTEPTQGTLGRETPRPVRLLLINPRFPESFWSFRWAIDKVLVDKRAVNPPLGLATLAALCPPEWEVTIVDENVEALPVGQPVDIVGVCGMGVQHPRQLELLSFYRRQGAFVVAGGSFASLCPERYEGLADAVIAGEAEYIWPAFCRDYINAAPQRLYREAGVVELADSPAPRFELLKLDRYVSASLQFSRGCPYRCEFCDIIVMFGRRPRTKAPEQIGVELDRLRELGVRRVFFVDDNLIGHKPKAKALLAFLIDYQHRHGYAFQFGTEVSINVAEDKELLALLRDANFTWLFIGIESPDAASLEEAGKAQNLRGDMLTATQTIYRHGIDVLAGFIVGFDNDTLDTFEHQYRFIMASGIQIAMVGLLTALPRTPLYQRLQHEGRLLPDAREGDNTRIGTNFVPRRMSYDTMVTGYMELWQRLTSDASIAARILAKTRYLRQPVRDNGDARSERLAMLARFVLHGLLARGPRRWFHFSRSLLGSPPGTWSLVVNDWVCALSMQRFATRHLCESASSERNMAQATLDFIRQQCAAGLRQRTLEVSLRLSKPGTQLIITIRGAVDKYSFTRATRRIEKLLECSATTLSLRIESLAAGERQHLTRSLRRLGRYGDRITVRMSASVGALLPVDWSVFRRDLDEA
ncbi:MAG: B12-binding domain-containing radical SAM protein [Gammaproteobacteria bacterium]|nr:MAG: B12-binding domain-containing radical SAM protein [Gammaproteobacteria bacterium]